MIKRIIPCLDTTLDEQGRAVVVKGIEFENLKYAGDPVELAKRYDAQGADELVFLDISASYERRETMTSVVEQIAEQISIPLSVGGGIKSIEDFERVFEAGADKVGVNTAGVKNPGLIKEAAERFGTDRIVVAIDCKRRLETIDQAMERTERMPVRLEDGRMAWYEVVIYGGRQPVGIDAIQWAKQVEALGAAEILLTSKDRDGTTAGYDIPITRALAEAVDIPVIASGGAGDVEHMYEAFVNGADACLAASIFHYGRYTVAEVKAYLGKKGIHVRQ
ncbi:MAG: imidazole glycerol phosphate synthase subunit HisF [Methanophagales archaeon ANME-1-THS]|nr:MAG: imidazole glycerol phosphate synthase subunit HisF [Methanophagales archaeon ANME-1-THS]